MRLRLAQPPSRVAAPSILLGLLAALAVLLAGHALQQHGHGPSPAVAAAASHGAPSKDCPPGDPSVAPAAAADLASPFQPEGYELPQVCEKHHPLYPAVFDYLRPWFVRGITQADMDACTTVAPPGFNVSLGTPQQDGINPKFRFYIDANEVLVTSGGMERVGGHGQQAVYYHMVTQIQMAARRFGLPNIEFAVGFGDLPWPENPQRHEAMCPLMGFSKHDHMIRILIPNGEFLGHGPYEEFVERMATDPGPPWEQREERAVGRWSLFGTELAHRDRWGNEEQNSREWYVKHGERTNNEFTSFASSLTGSMPLGDQRSFKYSFNTDGFVASTRFAKLLATGQLIIKEDSGLDEFYYPALKPWVHYVPSGWNGFDEVDRIVQFLRTHDSLARGIAASGQRFARTHLVEEGRLCYLKVLFEEMAKLFTYKPAREDFPTTISWDEDVARYTLDPETLAPVPD